MQKGGCFFFSGLIYIDILSNEICCNSDRMLLEYLEIICLFIDIMCEIF